MRVLHVHSGNLYGGIETILVCLAANRRSYPGMDPEFALCFEGRLSHSLVESGVAVHFLPSVHGRNPVSVWRARARLRELIRQREFELVVCHSPWTHTMFSSAVRSLGRRLVFWQHGVFSGRHWSELCARLTPPDVVISASEFARGSLAKVFPGVPCAVIHPPVAAPEIPDSTCSRKNIRAELRTAEHDVVVIQVARMEPGKGQMLQLQALRALRKVPNWTCWFAGGAQRAQEIRYFDALQNYAHDAGIAERIRFLGDRSDIGSLLFAADLLSHPTVGPEGFGIVLVEGLYAGLPVIAADLGALREIVSPSCGLLVRPGDEAALAENLLNLIRDPVLRAGIGRGGPSRARRLCEPTAQINKLGTQLTAIARKAEVTSGVYFPGNATGAQRNT